MGQWLLQRPQRLPDRRLLPRDAAPDRRRHRPPVRARRDRPASLPMSVEALRPSAAVERSWFDRPSPDLALDLLGSRLVHASADGVVGGRIVEVEAYRGPEDLAAHSSRGRTARNGVMFG